MYLWVMAQENYLFDERSLFLYNSVNEMGDFSLNCQYLPSPRLIFDGDFANTSAFLFSTDV
jgi:hypothetical protein